MANFREADKAVLFTSKVKKIPSVCFEKGWDVVAIKENTYLDLLQHENLNVLYKNIRVRGNVALMISVSKKFDLLMQDRIASVGTIAVVPKNSISAKKYIKDAQKYISLYEAFLKNEQAKEEKRLLLLKAEEMKKELSLLKKKSKALKIQNSLDTSQVKESRNCSAEIESLSQKIELAKISIPHTLSMMGLLKQAGLDDISENQFARSWEFIGEYGKDFYVFKYDYITMMGFFRDSVKRGEKLKKVFEEKVAIDVLPLKQTDFEVIQVINKDFLEAIKSNDRVFDSFENPFVEKEEQEVIPPLLPPSSGNIINLLFSGVLNGEMETEDMGNVLVKGSTLKKRKRVDNYIVDTLSQELYIFKTRDYSIMKESIM